MNNTFKPEDFDISKEEEKVLERLFKAQTEMSKQKMTLEELSKRTRIDIDRLKEFESLESTPTEKEMSRIESHLSVTKGLLYVNSLGEYSWEDKSKHVKHITEKDIEVISDVLKEDLRQSKSALEDSEKGRPNVAEYNLKSFDAAIEEMKMDIAFDESVLERISKPETIEEREWRRIFIYIIKADNKDMAKFFEMEIKDDKYYEDLQDTATRVEPLSGLPTSNRK